jgi:hypothetical protein
MSCVWKLFQIWHNPWRSFFPFVIFLILTHICSEVFKKSSLSWLTYYDISIGFQHFQCTKRPLVFFFFFEVLSNTPNFQTVVKMMNTTL